MSIETLMEWHRPRLESLIEAKCDLLAIETIPSIKEARAIANLLALYHPDFKAWLAFSCKDGEHLCSGETFKDAYEAFIKMYEDFSAMGFILLPAEV